MSWPHIGRMIDVPLDVPPGLGNFKPVGGHRQRAAAISWARSRRPRSRLGIMRAITPDRSQEKARWYQGQGRAMKAAIAYPAKPHVRTVELCRGARQKSPGLCPPRPQRNPAH